MAAPHVTPRLPLLERLGRAGRDAAGRDRVLDAAGVRDSVGRELVRLLNTRGGEGIGAPLRAGVPLSIVDYGLPDWSALYAASFEDRQRLARAIERAVRAFEPRLRDPRAEVDPHPSGQRQLLVALTGRLWLGIAAVDVRYGVGLDGNGAVLLTAEEAP